MKEVKEIFHQGNNRPILVFITFRESMNQLKDFLKKFRVAVINGDVSAKNRGVIVNDFQAGQIDFLLLQPKAASHGLTLTEASTTVWFTPFPSNEVYQQANARTVRPGQTRTQLIIRLYSSDAEKRMYKALDNKEKMSTLLLDLIKS
jgi:SNF2 family DNA or RNA helicase